MPKRKTIGLAKITRPAYSGILKRKRLFRILDKGLKGCAVWVSGPPGSGKTILVSSYIESRRQPCLWYSVDAGDTDAATFFYYMGLAASSVKRTVKRKPLPLLTPEHIPGVCTFARRYFEDLYGRFRAPFTLVFDNYNEVPESSLFHEIIRESLSALPRGIKVIFISRGEPPPVLSRLRVLLEMKLIGYEDLALTSAESLGIIRLKLKRELPRKTALELHSKANGWASGLTLMLEKAKKGSLDTATLKEVAKDAIFDYFATEVFGHLEPGVMEFLLKTAVLPGMDPVMAEHLTGVKNAGRILSDLNQNNYFTERLSRPEPVYRYHPLFREFLISRAKDSFDPDEMVRLKRRAAEILEESGRVEDAFALYRESRDPGGIVHLITEHAPELIAQERFSVLECWISNVPEETLSASPRLLYWQGICRLPFDPASARKKLEASFSLFKATDGETGVFLAWSGVVDTFLYEWKDFHPLDRWIGEFGGLIERYKKLPSGELGERVSCSIFSALMFRQPQHPELPEWEAKVRRIIQDSEDHTQRICTSGNLILYYLWTGNIAKAASLVNALSPAFKQPGASALPRLMWFKSEGLYNIYVSRYRASLETAEEGLKVSEETGIRLLDTILLGIGVLCSLALGETGAAEARLNKIASSMDGVRCFDVIFYHHQASMVALHRGEFPSAIEHALLCLKLSEEAGSPFIEEIHRYVLAYILIEAAKHCDVAGHIARIRKTGKDTKSTLFEYLCLILESLLALNAGEEKSCIESLANALTLAKAQGIKFFPCFMPVSASRLCAKALSAGIEADFVRELIRLNNLTPDHSLLCGQRWDMEDWPWPLKIYTLGRFELVREGVARITSPGRAQHKPIELLKAIVSFGGREVAEERLTDSLWPEADGDAAHRAFTTTLHRLRKLIGIEKAVRLKEGRISLDERYCWVDAWAFECLITETDRAVKKAGYCEGAVKMIEKALGLYRGSFLPEDADKAWSASQRERFKTKLLRHIGAVGCHLEEMGDFSGAALYFQAGLEIDALTEEFCQRLMNCYCRLGQRPEALAVYGRLRETLKTSLGIEPSPRTRSIYKSLLS